MATTPPPLLFITEPELELLCAAFQYQRALVEARLNRLVTHELAVRQLPSTADFRARIIESDADCRFQKRIMALDSQLLDQISNAIYRPAGAMLGRTDFYHLVRVVVAAGDPPSADMIRFAEKLRSLDPLGHEDTFTSVTLRLKDPLRTAPLNPLHYSSPY